MKRIAAMAAMLLGLAAPASAQQIPALVDLPSSAAASSPGLAARRAALLQERAALHGKIDAMNARCRAVEEGSAAEKACDIEQAALTNSLNSHVQQSQDFNAAAQAAVVASATPIANSPSDISVVDARNVPSGLAKSVTDAIDSGYSGAPPGVSDRVRKGFQAITAHDWKVARAWFQDALNRDPKNAGLKRLAELADYTQKRIEREIAAKTGQSPLASSQLRLPEPSDIQYLFPPELAPKNAGKPMEMPSEWDFELLFPGLPAIAARELNDFVYEQFLNGTENDPELIRLSNPPAPRPTHN